MHQNAKIEVVWSLSRGMAELSMAEWTTYGFVWKMWDIISIQWIIIIHYNVTVINFSSEVTSHNILNHTILYIGLLIFYISDSISTIFQTHPYRRVVDDSWWVVTISPLYPQNRSEVMQPLKVLLAIHFQSGLHSSCASRKGRPWPCRDVKNDVSMAVVVDRWMWMPLAAQSFETLRV